MDKVKDVIKTNRVILLFFWLALVYLIFLGTYTIVLNKAVTVTQILFVFAFACFIYVDIVLSIEYANNKKMLSNIKGIETRYEYIQTYLKNNEIIIEVQKKELEKLKKDLEDLQVKFKKLNEDDKLVQYAIEK